MNGTPSRYQAFISALFLITVVLMATQYTVYRRGPAIVIVAPFGWSQPSDISKQTEPGKPDEGAEPRAAAPDIQQPGLFVVNWDVFDQVAYKLHDAKQYPPAEMLLALLFLLALPLVLILHSRPVWPRWPQWVLVALGLTSLLGAEHFNAAVRENAQLVLTVLACFWLAGAALAEERQLKRFDLWLAALTIVLLLLAGWDYFVHVLRPPASAEVPTMVRATCASRSAYSGLMAMLLAMGFGRVVGSGNKLEGIGWSAVCGLGVCTLMNAGAVIALVVACLGMARVRGKATFVSALVFVPLAVGLATYSVGQRHVQHLAESIGFYHLEDGRRAAVEKRWLEMAASLNALEDARDVMPPTEDPATGSAEVKGKRSNLVFGVGAGLNYQKCIGSYYRSLDNPEKEEPDTYNLYLLLAVQLGLFGALAWAWLLADGMGNARRAYERLSDPELRS
ncbi:MAG: hypothetical protein HYU66_00820, partial [Armatimonadetes bacterium]|nr:hypothetical protein [Armatimonadota bacterium]